MSNKTCMYVLRTIHQLHSLNCLMGPRNLKLSCHCSSKCVLTVRRNINSWTCAPIPTTIPVRFLCQQTPLTTEDKNATSDLVNQSLNDTAVSLDRKENVILRMEEMPTGDKGTMKDQSSIMKALKQSNSPFEVLDTIDSSPHSRHTLFKVVMSLWQNLLALDARQKELESQLICEHPHFPNLCKEVLKAAPAMTPEMLVHSLYVLVQLGVDQKSVLIQTLLSVCRVRLSVLNVNEILILADALQMLESDRNVDVLTSGLQLLIEFKYENVKSVAALLKMMKSVGKNASLNLKSKLERKALQMVDKFTVDHCHRMFCVLAEINLISQPLLSACSGVVIKYVDELSFAKVISFLSCCQELSYYNIPLLTAIGEYVMNNKYMMKNWQVIVTLYYMSKLRFRHFPLLDSLAEYLIQHSHSLSVKDFTLAVHVYATLNHVPEANGQEFLESLNKTLELHCYTIQPTDLLQCVSSLLTLGYYPQLAINKLLQDKSVQIIEENGASSILQYVKVCMVKNPSILRSSIMQNVDVVPLLPFEDINCLHNFLQTFFKDPSLYHHSVKIPNSFYIDFILALDTEQNKLVPVANVQSDDGAHNIVRVAVLCCTLNAFVLGSLHPMGKMVLKMRFLESLGFYVVLIPVHKFKTLGEEGRVEFVRKLIFGA